RGRYFPQNPVIYAQITASSLCCFQFLPPSFAFLSLHAEVIRTCIHNLGMPDGRGFFSSDKDIFRSNPDGLQGKTTQYGGKKTGQTALNGCEYRF
ncbi:MAG: hypothetical protein K2P26_11955, partial [Oscillospiraceae bacterium]|nr:hypothetical protein [Oscillospiraceae bacterium]